jgi:hypothetical protein
MVRNMLDRAKEEKEQGIRASHDKYNKKVRAEWG